MNTTNNSNQSKNRSLLIGLILVAFHDPGCLCIIRYQAIQPSGMRISSPASIHNLPWQRVKQ